MVKTLCMLAVLSPIVAGAQTGPWGEPAQIVPPVMTSQPLSGVTMELPFMEGSGTVAHDISGQGNDATFCTTGSAPVWQPEGGFVASERAIVAHATLAQAAGAELHARERVLGWEPIGNGVRVRTERGDYEAAKLILCACNGN